MSLAVCGLISAVQPRAVETQTRSAEKLIADGMKRRSPLVEIGLGSRSCSEAVRFPVGGSIRVICPE